LRSAYRMNKLRDRRRRCVRVASLRIRKTAPGRAGRAPQTGCVASAPRFRSGLGRRLDNRRTARPGHPRRAASLRRPAFAPPRKFRGAAPRPERLRSCCHHAFRTGDYFVGLPSCISAFSSFCLTPSASASSSRLSAKRGSRFMNISRWRGPSATRRTARSPWGRFVADAGDSKWGRRKFTDGCAVRPYC
jgi:hypothetical protein